jgi:hypothetical protein
LHIRGGGFGEVGFQQRQGFPAMTGFGKMLGGLAGCHCRGQRAQKEKFH